jgi:hypothetical protein
VTRRAKVWVETAGGVAAVMATLACLLSVVPRRPGAHQPLTAVAEDVPLPSRAEPVASYLLSARLDAGEHVIAGSGEIRWRNASKLPATELYLHLYLNAFESDRTLFLRSPFGAARNHARPERWGNIEIKRLVARELGGIDLWPSADRHSPDDPDDRTDLRVPLPTAVEPEAELTLEVEFVSKLPSLVERTGFSGNFHFAGQWFPKLARREPDGAWRHFAFHPQAEFYADYGSYQVSLDVPEAMRVGATGARVSERVEKGRRVVRHVAEGVHDFAWTAWDGFSVRHERVDGVDVELLYPAGHEQNTGRSLAALRFALPEFRARYGRYPYPVLTVVDPPPRARFAGGMEYPMLITTGAPWWAGYLTREVEGVTVHELAHQWFYGLVATDEADWPCLDEGLASYAAGVALARHFGPGSLVDWPGLVLSDQEARRVAAQAAGAGDVVAQPARNFANFVSLGELAYARTATALVTLGNVYGQDRLARALGRYARAQRFQHPGPAALLESVERELGKEAAEALRGVLFERARVDYRARWLTSFAEPSLRPGAAPPVPSASSSAGTESYLGRVLVVREGTLRLPVEIDLIDSVGRRQRRHWDGQGNWTWITYQGPNPLVLAVVDPERKLTLDDSFANNAVSDHLAPPARTLELATFLAELFTGGPWP